MPNVTLVKFGEVADILQISKKTLLRWEKQGYIAYNKKIKGIRHYSVESIVQLLEYKRNPYTYFVRMDNNGALPNTLNVMGNVRYGDTESVIITEDSDIEPGYGCSIFNGIYRKKILEDGNLQVVKGHIPVILSHFDKSHKGPVSSVTNEKVINLRPTDLADARFDMEDIWSWEEDHFSCFNLSNNKTIPPKSLIGIESIKTETGYENRYIRYEKIGGHADMIDEDYDTLAEIEYKKWELFVNTVIRMQSYWQLSVQYRKELDFQGLINCFINLSWPAARNELFRLISHTIELIPNICESIKIDLANLKSYLILKQEYSKLHSERRDIYEYENCGIRVWRNKCLAHPANIVHELNGQPIKISLSWETVENTVKYIIDFCKEIEKIKLDYWQKSNAWDFGVGGVDESFGSFVNAINNAQQYRKLVQETAKRGKLTIKLSEETHHDVFIYE